MATSALSLEDQTSTVNAELEMATQFVDFRKAMYAGSVMGSLGTRVGLTPLTPAIFAVWSLILSTRGQIGLPRSYARLAEEQTRAMGQLPGLSFNDLEAGNLGPLVRPGGTD